MAIAEEWE